jgi:hypothetical protein
MSSSNRQFGRVLLFSGHMIDARGRAKPRFPSNMESVAASAIADALNKIGANRDDLGITEGACGGDLLFAEALLRCGARLRLYLPFSDKEFVQKSVVYRKEPPLEKDPWKDRYYRVRGNPLVDVKNMPKELGPLKAGKDPYEQCNLWMLKDALELSAGKVHFICLWNGEGGDGRGGTAHMIDAVRQYGGRVSWLDPRVLWLK